MNANEYVFWDSTVFATIVGGLIGLVTAIVLLIIQNWQKQTEDKKTSEESDVRKVLGIKDYLEELQKNLETIKTFGGVCRVILPFANQIEFSEYNATLLRDIRKSYNFISLKTHALHSFLTGQDTTGKSKIYDNAIFLQRQQVLRDEILKQLTIIMPKIEAFLNEKTGSKNKI